MSETEEGGTIEPASVADAAAALGFGAARSASPDSDPQPDAAAAPGAGSRWLPGTPVREDPTSAPRTKSQACLASTARAAAQIPGFMRACRDANSRIASTPVGASATLRSSAANPRLESAYRTSAISSSARSA